MSLEGGREGGEGRGGEGRGGREGIGGGREGGDRGGRGGMTVIHIILMAPYIQRLQTNNEELYLYNNDVTYYVITCNSAFEYNNDVTYYVITRNYQWTPEILTNNLLEAGCTNKLCPFQYKFIIIILKRLIESN